MYKKFHSNATTILQYHCLTLPNTLTHSCFIYAWVEFLEIYLIKKNISV